MRLGTVLFEHGLVDLEALTVYLGLELGIPIATGAMLERAKQHAKDKGIANVTWDRGISLPEHAIWFDPVGQPPHVGHTCENENGP